MDSYARKRTEGRGSYDDAIFLGWIHDEIRIVYGSLLMVAQREEEKEKEEEEEEEKEDKNPREERENRGR